MGEQPVSVGIDAHHPAFKLYESGVFDIDYCTSRLTHAVLLTGYGVDDDGAEYYNLKNSWGKGWGTRVSARSSGAATCAPLPTWPHIPLWTSQVQQMMTLQVPPLSGMMVGRINHPQTASDFHV